MALVILENNDDGVATLTLNLPEKMNAISMELQREMSAALSDIDADRSVRAVILTGAGKAFCVGADLSSLRDVPAGTTLGNQMATWMQTISHPMIESLRALPMPLICAVNGPCAGAGVGLALCADVVVAAQSAYFYLPFLPRLGLVPDLGCTWMMPRLVGRARAMGMSLLDERLTAQKAVEWGMIWECCDDALLVSRSHSLAIRLAELPEHAVREARSAFVHSEKSSFSEQMFFESERQRILVEEPSFHEGVDAFMQKRKPVFTNK